MCCFLNAFSKPRYWLDTELVEVFIWLVISKLYDRISHRKALFMQPYLSDS